MDGSTIQDYISRMERADTYSSKASLFSNLVEDLFDKLDAKILMMSATKPKREVLERVFGIDLVLVEGEPEFPGTLLRKVTGREVKVNHGTGGTQVLGINIEKFGTRFLRG